MRLGFSEPRSELSRRIACAFLAAFAAAWSLLPVADALEHQRAGATLAAELPAVGNSTSFVSCVLCDLINTSAGVPASDGAVVREPAREHNPLTPPAYAPVGAPAGSARSRAPPTI
jgi:hypothetical protein